MRMQRLQIDRSTLDLISSDAQDLVNVLNAAGLHKASSLMLGVLEQLALDRETLPDEGTVGEQGPLPT